LGSFSVTELLFPFAAVTLVASLLASPEPWSRPVAITAALGSSVLVASHEAATVCAVPLIVHAVLRRRRSGLTFERWACKAIVAAGCLSIAWAVAIRTSFPNSNGPSFFASLRDFDPTYTVVIVGSGVLIVAWALLPRAGAGGRGPSRVTAALGLGAALVLGAYGAWRGISGAIAVGPAIAYPSRGWALVAVLLGQLTLLAVWLLRSRVDAVQFNRPGTLQATIPVLFLIGLMAIPVSQALQWNNTRLAITHAVSEHSGRLTVDEALPERDRLGLWSWTTPYLSQVMRPNADSAVIYPNEGGTKFNRDSSRGRLAPVFVWR
jgi:hypothetical protein